jgi:hypothetical protein
MDKWLQKQISSAEANVKTMRTETRFTFGQDGVFVEDKKVPVLLSPNFRINFDGGGRDVEPPKTRG